LKKLFEISFVTFSEISADYSDIYVCKKKLESNDQTPNCGPNAITLIMKKTKKKVVEALAICEHWLPLLNEFALEAGNKPYEHPWVPVEVVREIARILKTDDK
jgi:hypothetical protein